MNKRGTRVKLGSIKYEKRFLGKMERYPLEDWEAIPAGQL
jgi:hypothetical protein